MIQRAAVVFAVIVLLAPLALAQLTADDIAQLKQRGVEESWTFEVTANPATEYSLEQLTGLIVPDDWRETGRFDPMVIMKDLPVAFNWRDSGGCTPVKGQGSCGSCWAFSTMGPLECNILIQDGREVDLSEQYLVSCNYDGWSCNGGWMAHDYHMWKPDVCGDSGAVFENDFLYRAMDIPCGCPHPQREYYIDDWAYVGSEYEDPTVEQIKQAIFEYGPISVLVYANDAMQAYGGGIFNGCEAGDLNHAVVLVGWDDDQGDGGVWIMRNSWGNGWGELGGYMRMPYGCNDIGIGANYVDYRGGSYWTSDTVGGWVPIDVAFTAISGLSPSEWIWDFGDGQFAYEQSPVHTYEIPGFFDVTLSVVVDGDTIPRTREGCVSAIADTMYCSEINFGSGTDIEVVINAHNHVPLNNIKIPIDFSGGLSLDPWDFTWTTEGCRTEHMDYQEQVHYYPYGKQMAYRLANLSGGGSLPPGDGPILKLYFNADEPPAMGQETTIDISGYSTYQMPYFTGDYVDFQPATSNGVITYQNCCVGMRGNVDSDPLDQIDITDLIYLVTYMFQEGDVPACMEEANIDGDALMTIDIADLIHLVNYMFQEGPEPVVCD